MQTDARRRDLGGRAAILWIALLAATVTGCGADPGPADDGAPADTPAADVVDRDAATAAEIAGGDATGRGDRGDATSPDAAAVDAGTVDAEGTTCDTAAQCEVGRACAAGRCVDGALGAELVRNGGFEEGLSHWEVREGAPEATPDRPGIAAAEGSTYLWGGQGLADAVVVQRIDLLGLGLTPDAIDAGLAWRAEAAIKTWIGGTLFDDQAWVRAAFLGGDGAELGAARTIMAPSPAWTTAPFAALVPPGSRTIELGFFGRRRFSRDNDAAADAIAARLDALAPASGVRITKQPLLQDVRPDAMRLLWESDSATASHAIEWGRQAVGERRATRIETTQVTDDRFVHEGEMAPLVPGETYRYRVVSGDAASPEHTLTAPPPPGAPTRIAVTSDNQSGWEVFTEITGLIAARSPDLVLVPGDVVDKGSRLDDWQQQWFDPLAAHGLGQTVPVVFARGNHDAEHAYAYAYSALPGNEAWYAFSRGGARIIVLDTEVTSQGAPEQVEWLEAELESAASREASFRIVALHKPPFTDLWGHSGYTGEQWVRDDWVPIFEDLGVDLVLCGHTHGYERGARNGVTYAIVGGAGGSLDTWLTERWDLFDVIESTFNYSIMAIDGPTLRWTTYDRGDAVVDTFELTSRSRP